MNYFENIGKFKENVALITEKEKFTYNSIINFSQKILKGLKERSLILIRCNNCFEVLLAYISFNRINCAIILVEDNLVNNSYIEIINAYQPDYIFQKKNKKIDNINYTSFNSFGSHEILKKKNKDNLVINENLSILIPTSGSMGSPKFVRYSYENIHTNINQVTESLNVTQSDRAITTMPLNYTYGLSIINSHLFNGASLVLNNYSLIDKKFWNFFNKENVTNFGGVPFMYEILSKIGFDNKIPKNLKYITQAGGRLSNDLIKKFFNISKKNNFEFVVMYGQTEATSRMSYLHPSFLDKKIGSIGKPVKNGNFSIQDKNGRIIKDENKVGQLIYEGKNVSMGYALNKLDLINGDENNGKLFTGDLAKRDNDNFYYIVGRIKRISKIFGMRLNLDDLEILLKKWGYRCACTGNDNLLDFFIEDKFDSKDMLDKISKNIGLHKSVIRLNKINRIPRNKSGKILYLELNQNAE